MALRNKKQSKKKRISKVFVAMSGGVDSSVAAAWLKKQGYDVTGIHIKMWSDPDIPCNFKEDRYEAMRVAAILDIPFQTWDLTKEYKKGVVDYMIREFQAGRTPNPDVMCNKRIKFDAFLKKALERGADYVATGHYVKLERVPSAFLSKTRSVAPASNLTQLKFGHSTLGGNHADQTLNGFLQETPRPVLNYKLLQAKDKNKDQSYFLWTLTQEQLRHCLFPIGEFTKPEVRKMARKFKLPNAEKKDSQGICFIGEIDLNNFLKKYIQTRLGKIITTEGKEVGKHDGLSFYTIGQRHGLGLGGGGIPYYVAQKDFKKNHLIVAQGPYDDKLFSPRLTVKNINWISGNPPTGGPKFPLKCEARIRYRQPPQKCVLTCHLSLITCRFSEPQRAVTPGQSVVFYKNSALLGGGIIK